jgi:NADH-quinone oxidoreductase subunit C
VVEAPPPLPASATSTQATDFETLLKTEFGVTEFPKNGPPLIPAARHLELATKLKGMGYRLYDAVVASHWLAGISRAGKTAGEPEHYEVATVLRSVGQGSKTVTWAVRLSVGEPLQSLAGLFAGADWQEREQYDLVGVKFAGHPDLRRLMMPENYDKHPLRRDLPADMPYAPWR